MSYLVTSQLKTILFFNLQLGSHSLVPVMVAYLSGVGIVVVVIDERILDIIHNSLMLVA